MFIARISRGLLGLLILLLAGSLPPGPARARDLSAILAQFESHARQAMADEGIPGMAVAIVYNDQVVYLKGFGVRSLSDSTPVDPETIFQIGSTSKAFTSALVAMMVDQGKLAWNDRVIDHLPDFRMFDPWVTREFQVRDLMSQHSGLAAYTLTLAPILGYPTSLVLDSMRLVAPVTSFRADFAYQNCLFESAAALVEKYTSLDFPEALKRRIFEPLGMSRSTGRFSERARFDNVSGMHLRWEGQVVELPADSPLRDWTDNLAAAGGVNSCARDMANWLRLQLGGGRWQGRQLVSSDNLDYLHRPHTIVAIRDTVQLYYCQGWICQLLTYPQPYIWHNGDTNFAHAFVGLVPAENLGIVILGNLGGTHVPDQLAGYFLDLYFGTSSQTTLADLARQLPLDNGWPAPPAPTPPPPLRVQATRDLSLYAGVYRHPVLGDLKVTVAGQGLVLTCGPKDVTLNLTPWSGDTFSLSIPYLREDGGLAYFLMDQNKRAGTLVIPLFTYEGGQEATRVE